MAYSKVRAAVRALVLAAGLAAVAGMAAAAPPPAAKPAITDEAADQQLVTVPLFKVLKQYYPDAYAKVRGIMVSGLNSGRTMLSMQNEIRTSYAGVLKSQLSKADPRAIVEMIAITKAEAEATIGTPKDCMAVLGYRPFDRGADMVVPAEISDRELAWSAATLEQTATKPYKPLSTPANPTAALQAMGRAAYDRMSSDESRRRLNQARGKFHEVEDAPGQRAVCEFNIMLYDVFIEQPTPEAVEVFRAVLATAPQP